MFPSKFTEFTETFVLCQVLKDTAKHFSFKKKEHHTILYHFFPFLTGKWATVQRHTDSKDHPATTATKVRLSEEHRE